MQNAIYKVLRSSPLPYLLFWLVLNLIQSAFTELFHDEALYWFCSQNLSWGFWDHPPAAPFFIFLGYSLFSFELGVRLFIVAASGFTIWGIWRLVEPKDNRLFFALAFSVFLVHIGGFMAAPDIPLLLFSVWFLVVLKEYLTRDSWGLAAVLGVLVACMAYSKYHGAIFLFFALLPNLKLLRRPSFWLIPILALLLFSPHLYWQWAHGFPTFRYHLIDRAGDTYQWTFILDYLGGQLLVMGPLVSILLLLAAAKFKAQNAFERTLKWSLWGILGFFLFQSFSQRTEANWTAVAIVPLIYLAYHFVIDRPSWKKWSFGLAIPSLVLVVFFRFYLMVDFLPEGMNPRNEFHGWDKWALDISEVAEDRPVIFYNTYRGPSKYAFYAKKPAHAINTYSHAGNQYDLLPEKEEALQGKEVLIVDKNLKEGTPFVPGGLRERRYMVVDNFRSYNRVRIRVLDAPENLPMDTLIELRIELHNPIEETIHFMEGERKVNLNYLVFKKDNVFLRGKALSELPFDHLKGGETQRWDVVLQSPDQPGEYRYRYGFEIEGLFVGRNGNFNPLEVE